MVKFTMDELLQMAKYEASYKVHSVCTGVYAVYQMTAQHETPSVAAEVALRAV
jgi:hypothetical protein